MTLHHRGRCSRDPKLVSVETPGPAHLRMPPHEVMPGGSQFGLSRSLQREETKVAEGDDLHGGTVAATRFGARAQLGNVPPPDPSVPHHMISGAPRMARGSGAAPPVAPGPRYNVRYSTPSHMRAGAVTKFTQSGRTDVGSRVGEASPGPAYLPSQAVTSRTAPQVVMASRTDVGSMYTVKKRSPGPIYYPSNPGRVNEPSISFGPRPGLRESRVARNKRLAAEKQSKCASSRKRRPRKRAGGGGGSSSSSSSTSSSSASSSRVGTAATMATSGSAGSFGSRPATGDTNFSQYSRPPTGSSYAGGGGGSVADEQLWRPAPILSPSLIATASISLMRTNIWKKIRGRGGIEGACAARTATDDSEFGGEDEFFAMPSEHAAPAAAAAAAGMFGSGVIKMKK